MKQYTSTHWGLREVVEGEGGKKRLVPYSGDPDPSPIGLDQLEDRVQRMRIRRPAVRESWLKNGPAAAGERTGKDPFVEVDWDIALDLAAKEIKRVRDEYSNEAIFGGCYGWSSAGRFHHAQSQIHRFLNCYGGYVRHVNTYSLGAAHVIMGHIVEPMGKLMVSHTSWDVIAEHTKLFVSFGGVALKSTQVSPGGVARHTARGGLSALAGNGARIVNIGPVGDNLEADGAEWFPIRPNTDTAVMLALCYVLYTEDLHDKAFLDRYCVGFEKFAAYLVGKSGGEARTPEWAERISGMPAQDIIALARSMASTRTMVNMAWSLQRASHGEQPCWAIVTLASMLGQIGLPGGGFGCGYGSMNVIGSNASAISGPTFSQGSNPVKPYIPCARIADMLLSPGEAFHYNGNLLTYPDIRLIYWAGGNPFHHHQDLNRLMKAWQKPETIIVNEQYWTATARRADIVFPAAIPFERDDIGYASREGHLVAMRQVVPPLGEARDDYDILAGIAERLGVREAFTEGLSSGEWLRRIYEEARAKAKSKVDLPDFDTFWEEGLIMLDNDAAPVVMLSDFRGDPDANPLSTPSGKIEIFSEHIASFGYDDCYGHAAWFEPHEWLGQCRAEDDRLHLLSDQPARRLHSQLDASEHSRGGKIDGREQVDVNPEDAQRLGISAGDTVELFNKRGRCLAVARLTPSLMPGVARLNTGAWYDPDEDGLDKAGNPNVLSLDIGTSKLAQGSIAQSCLIHIRGPVNDAPTVTSSELPELR